MSKNQHGSSGFSVRTPLAIKLDRYQRMQAMHQAGNSLETISRSFQISRERARQILSGGIPRPPGKPRS